MPNSYGSYNDVETRIQNALATYNLKKPQKLTVLAHNFHGPYNRLQCRFNGRTSKQQHSGTNQPLHAAQEVALCSYITCCNKISMPALVPQLKSVI
jgi:hypothetical protein